MTFEKNHNNENLLITIGDSWTEGVGCYSDELLFEYQNRKIDLDQLTHRGKIEGTFNTGSWAYQLSNDIGYDLLNLGEGGTANSWSAKKLINDFDNDYLSKYNNVIVIWLLSEPSRFSFYCQNNLASWMPAYPSNVGATQRFLRSYFEEVNPSFEDDVKETKFYVKAVDSFCKARGYKFAYGAAFTEFSGFENVSNNLHNFTSYKNFNVLLSNIDKRALFAPDQHPNQLGYQYIGTEIAKILRNNLKFV